MKSDEIRGKTNLELDTLLASTKRELFELRFGSHTGTESNSSRTNELRRNVARILTVLQERELGVRGQQNQR